MPPSPSAGPKNVFVGTSGWSYEDWRGIVYPSDRPTRFDELAYLAQFFDATEVNTSFYRPPPARFTRSWLRRTAFKPDFTFTFKLWQRFTHQREDRWSQAEADEFRQGVGPAAEAGRLGAVLLQFPWSFRFTDENQDWLSDLVRTFQGWPLVVEVRHISWAGDEGLAAIRGLGLSFCNIDQPVTRDSIAPAAFVTGPIGYVRFHGRNREAWFKTDAGSARRRKMGSDAAEETSRRQTPSSVSDRDQRYNYLYRQDELTDWVTRIGQLADETERVYVFMNNHYRGQAPANALQVLSDLHGGPVPVPEPLVSAYPFLDRIALRPPNDCAGPGRLF
jgi:uncharacterized protein YecE (DUF72 family)